MTSPVAHKPVLLREIIAAFKTHAGENLKYLDGTFGRGGHLRACFDTFTGLHAWALDCDLTAVEFARENFAAEISAGRLNILHANYANFAALKTEHQWPGFDLMLLDLGVSSPQLDQAERGFSFYHDGPLDMRMDVTSERTAEEIVNTWSEDDLLTVFRQLGEVRRPGRVLRAILHDRKDVPFTTTRQLASLIERVDGWHKKGIHPATQYFMGIRLAVNNELIGLRESLPDIIAGLAPSGLLAVITFHSLEDRIVKNIFKDHLNIGRLVNKKVIVADEAEIEENSRSRSAKLRIFERTS